MRLFLPVGVLTLSAALAACSSAPASTSSRPVYSTNELGTVKSELKGEIISIREVTIQAPSRESGSTGTGATMGAATATGILTGNPGSVAGALGRVVGGGVGAKADDTTGEEIRVLLDDGTTRLIVQAQGKEILVPG